MLIDNIRLSKKLLLPVVVFALVSVCSAFFAANRLSTIVSDADGIIAYRAVAALQISRSARLLARAENYAYISLTTDPSAAIADVAGRRFASALEQAQSLLQQSVALVPEKEADILKFRNEIKKVAPKLIEAFEIGKKTPGLAQGAGLKPADLTLMAQGTRIMDEASVGIETLADQIKAFNDTLIAENAQGAKRLAAEASLAFWQILGGGLAGALLSGVLCFWLSSKKVAAPLSVLAAAMERLARGDVATEVVGTERGDEVGDMAKALQVFKDNAKEKLRLEEVAEEMRRTSEIERTRNEAMRAEEARNLSEVVSHVASGLDMLSKGKLTHRIQSSFPTDYERLRDDFNAAIGKLQQTLGVVSQNTSAIRSGSQEISTAADDLSRRTEQQAASLEETSAAIAQIVVAVRNTSEGANEARDFVLKAQAQARTSDEVVRRAVGAMNEINTSSNKIAQIISVIDEIAFQTNLLALNAGVEAARAGEAGRGFAVVASEVRALAQRSAEAAKEIKALIQASSTQVEQGVDLVGETGRALSMILTSINDISKIVQEIARSATEQSASLDEVSTAVRQMDLFTQQNAAMVEESTAASKGLAGESDELARLIGAFDVGEGRQDARWERRQLAA